MHQLLCIVGPTGTGKTKRAIEESLKQPSILVSADSRQVYRGMSIVTGKDHPDGVEIFGIDIVSPAEDCSVSVWYDAVMPHIAKARKEGKLPIVVGGTGLYVKALTDGIATMHVPINPFLRTQLESLSLTELQEKLSEFSPSKFDAMNNSDRHNPRRLVRAIEIATYRLEGRILARQGSDLLHSESTLIGLKYSDDRVQRNKIHERVLTRLNQGAIEETKTLLTQYSPDIKSMSAIGYKSIIAHLKGELTQDEMIDTWVRDELSYAKRQLTWFRKQNVIWYDVDNKETK